MYTYDKNGNKIVNGQQVRENYDDDKKLKTWQIVLIALSVAVVLGGVGWVLLRNKKAKTNFGFSRQRFGFRFY